ncbi:hypothetical protein J1G43_01005 [Cellulomonas sp. zg-ZUI22]|uniref:hypothetical protein n=1 Tax=Cellulomonas sp. zg-ZUI22 TaxID=2816955 RepID=UPI001A94C7B9|nr:hypothetical protein [Cellulomonas sp. zg-ZUI22]MBO0898545.1 hypothetical protein [Cellulomonas sp. zg-ZUI22]
MSGPEGMPVARPVDASASVDSTDDDASGERRARRVVQALLAVLLVLAVLLTDLGPMVCAAGAVTGAVGTVRRRRSGVLWWTVLEVAGWVLIVPVFLVLTSVADGLTPGALALQLVAGVLLGAVVAALVEPVRRTVRRGRVSPTAV